jgi:hypothetical protein
MHSPSRKGDAFWSRSSKKTNHYKTTEGKIMAAPDQYFRHSVPSKAAGGNLVTIYPLVCFHLGAQQCDFTFIQQHLARIKEDQTARWVYMGDGGECVTKLSKGGIYSQVISPQGQMDLLVDILTPIKTKGLFGIRGNHGQRIFRETGLGFDQNVCARLGIPYLGVSAMFNLVVHRSSYDLYFHHGIDSGITQAAKVSKAEHFSKFVLADAIFTSHSHVAMELQPAVLYSADNDVSRVRTTLRRQYICGSGYDSRTGYADDRGYPPLLPSFISVSFSGSIVRGKLQKEQQYRSYHSDGQHTLNHNYATKYQRDYDA